MEPNPANVEKWVDNAMRGNLRIAEARIDELIQRDQLRKSKARYTPKLEIVGSHGTSEQGGRFGSSEVDNTDIGSTKYTDFSRRRCLFLNQKKKRLIIQ